MKPEEFWDSRYREINLYTQANLYRITDEFKQQIKLQEAATDKLIIADAMSNKHPKIVPLQKTFENLFPENNKDNLQNPQEITKRMRTIMKQNN